MDADDILEAGSKAYLVNLWRSSGPRAAAMRITCRQDACGMVEFMQVRLFPRTKGMLFERRVHEQIMFSAQRLGIAFVQCPWVRIVHTGYAEAQARKAKARRNEPLIIAELSDHPDDPALLLNYGDCLMELERRDEALAAYRSIARTKELYYKHPDVFIQALFNIACLLHSKNEYREAALWLMACLNLDPTRIEALFMLGKCREALGGFQKAFDCFIAAARGAGKLRQTATNAEKIKIQSIYHCARILLSAGYYEQAQELLTHAITAYPRVVEYHTLLGQAAIKQNKLTIAAQAFTRSLSLSLDKNADSYIGMALVYALAHDLPKAREYLRRGTAALASSPSRE
jgi:tetratricopeptide (TPR) repeat protein